jgi:phosphoglucosamine mutase
VVGTILTNQGLEAFLHKKQKKLIRVPVGDKYIAERLDAENIFLGGEQSGHIILRDYLPTGDGIFVALRLLETLIQTNNWDMETFIKYPQVSVNVPVTVKKDLKLAPFAQIIEEGQAQLHSGRLIVRYSGTESLLRITAEDISLATAQCVVNSLSQKLKKELS